VLILTRMPVVLSSDKEWIDRMKTHITKPGSLIYIPEDAIVVAEELREVEIDPEDDSDIPF
jgi:hypothetical protein